MKRPLFPVRLWILLTGFLSFTASGQVDLCGLAWQRINATNSPGLWVGQASAYDSQRGVAVLLGGRNPLTGTPDTSETWEWNGASWTQRTSGNPGARSSGAMAYDSHRGVCVLFGGGTNVFQSELPFNDTWEWNGAIWTLRQNHDPSATNRPPPLDYPKMSYDSARRRMVLLGSTQRVGGQVQPATNTWEWDGNNWTVRATVSPSRFHPALAYDPVRRVTVLFGGSLQNDTWLWDGTNWTNVAVSGPAARDQHAMAFDLRRQVMVLFGGRFGGVASEVNDTWEWDGQSWSLRPYADRFGLIPRRQHQMWYDTADQRVIVFGGTWSRRNGDGSYDHFILDELWEARPPGWWVHFGYVGTETGSFYMPFNTLGEAVTAAPAGCMLNLKIGSSAEALTISKQLKLEAYNGPVTIGQ